jgi:hypothetical protein
MLFEVFAELVDAISSWRLYVCLVPTLLLAYVLHETFPGAHWPWLISVPAVIGALALGLRWEWKSSH